MSSNPSITLSNVGITWPDGAVALSSITATFSLGRTGLVGANGVGKSTLLRLIGGLVPPSTGSISTSGDVGYLPQTLTLDVGNTIADLLGIGGKVAALRAIEAGDADVRHFDTIGDDWDIDTQADEALREVGFSAADLDRRVDQISGGEAMLIAITGLRLRRTPIALLDEPTNNLDRDARHVLSGLVRRWKGTLLIVSHDIALLEQMDHTAELHAGQLTVFGGPYSQWKGHFEKQQAAAVQSARAAEQTLKVEKRQRIEAETRLAKRARTGQKNYDNKQGSKILMNQRASDAQVSAGKLRSGLDDKVQSAQATVDAAAAHVREERTISLNIPDPQVSRGRQIAELTDAARSYVIQGPERVAITGPNGVGKTTLLESVMSGVSSMEGRPGGRLLTDRFGYLTQRLDGLDESLSALDNVQAAAPTVDSGTIRNQLGRLLLRGDSVHRPVSTLSGGERFRVTLARILLTDPPAQLLLLDEPTNNLDLQSVDQLVDTLDAYRGAFIVVSHDDAFLHRLKLDMVLQLDPEGRLLETELPEYPVR